MGEQITLKTYLVYQAVIARVPGTSKDLAEAVEELLTELEEAGWERTDKRTWEQWNQTDLL